MMLAVRNGTEGTVAIAITEAMRPYAETLLDILAKQYPKATIRVIVNHCLQPEIVRVDRVDPEAARVLVTQLRNAPAAPPNGLHAKVAQRLNLESTDGFSLTALRDMVKPVDRMLAMQIDRAITLDRGGPAYCAFCAQPVDSADFVAGPEGRPSHATCLSADNAAHCVLCNGRNPDSISVGDRLVHETCWIRCLTELAPVEVVASHVGDPRPWLGNLDLDELRAMVASVLSQ